MPYEEMKAPAKKKDNKPKKAEHIADAEIKKTKRKSAINYEE